MSVTSDVAQPIWLRILRSPILRLLVLGYIMFQMLGHNNGFMFTFHDRPLVAIGITILMALAGIVIYIAYGRFIERREVTELAVQGMGKQYGLGLLLGAALYTLCIIVLMVSGMYTVTGMNPLSFLIPALAMALSSSVFEELFFRGVIMKSVEDLAGSWIAIVVSSLVFGFMHLLNPAGTIEGAIYISIEAGLLLAGAFLLTRKLWLCMGFHFGWNYTQSAIFSGIVSGGDADPGLLQVTIEGPDFMTGGSFGVESSVLALVACTTAGIIMIFIAWRRGHILPPPWTQR